MQRRIHGGPEGGGEAGKVPKLKSAAERFDGEALAYVQGG